MSSVRRDHFTGEQLGQCPGCKAYVVLDVQAWEGRAPLAAHQEWRPSLVHLFAEGRPWILQKRTVWARIVFLVLAKCSRYVLSIPCRHREPYNFAAEWPTTGFAQYGPKNYAPKQEPVTD